MSPVGVGMPIPEIRIAVYEIAVLIAISRPLVSASAPVRRALGIVHMCAS